MFNSGCVLLQERPDKTTKPIIYWSRLLAGIENIYDTTQREYLAIAWVVLLPRTYLEDTRFTVRTDHESLKWIVRVSDTSEKLAGWFVRLSELEFEVVHWAGVKHHAAHTRSRLRIDCEEVPDLDEQLPVSNLKNTHEAGEEPYFVHVFTERSFTNELKSGKPNEGSIGKIETRSCTVHLTKRQTTRARLLALD